MTDISTQADDHNLSSTVANALVEDMGDGDITAALIPADQMSTAKVITRDPMTMCGKAWVNEVFSQVDPGTTLTWHVSDGQQVAANTVLFELSGKSRAILTGERTALNFLQTLSATATTTAHYVGLISHTNAALLDTRKTIPGLRLAQKYAVKCGGGTNHRIGLFDAFLIKENHINACGSITKAIETARSAHPDRRLEVEVENLAEFREAIAAAPDWIMLDNFSLADLANAVAGNNQNIKLEASGGIENDSDLIAIAETGVDYISVGALTKHVKAIDLSMRLDD